MEPKVWTFFYGSYINFKVLKEVEIQPDVWEVAILHGYEIQIHPLANIIKAPQYVVYGILALLSHKELDRLYNHAEHVLGGKYFPHAILTETLKGKWVPALCYISHGMLPQQSKSEYIDRIVGPAKKYHFPNWYIDRLESFKEIYSKE